MRRATSSSNILRGWLPDRQHCFLSMLYAAGFWLAHWTAGFWGGKGFYSPWYPAAGLRFALLWHGGARLTPVIVMIEILVNLAKGLISFTSPDWPILLLGIVVNSPYNTVTGREEVISVMEQDFLNYRDFHKHVSYVGEKPEVTVVMGYDTMIPLKGPGAGKQVMRPFTDIWAKRKAGWQLVARQATIAAKN